MYPRKIMVVYPTSLRRFPNDKVLDYIPVLLTLEITPNVGNSVALKFDSGGLRSRYAPLLTVQ